MCCLVEVRFSERQDEITVQFSFSWKGIYMHLQWFCHPGIFDRDSFTSDLLTVLSFPPPCQQNEDLTEIRQFISFFNPS